MPSSATAGPLRWSPGTASWTWWPAPRFDSPSAFSALLDPDAGHWSLRPAGSFERAGWRYLPGTLVAETELRTETGLLRVTDALAFAPGARGHQIGRESPHALVRVAEAVAGTVELELRCRARLEYGLAVPELIAVPGGVATLGGAERLFLRGDGPLAIEGGEAVATRTLPEGDRAGWVLHRVPGAFAEPPPALDPHATLADTIAAWRSWAEQHGGYHGLHETAVHRATSSSRGSRTSRRAASSRRPRRRCPRKRAGPRTGTTATSGCATRR